MNTLIASYPYRYKDFIYMAGRNCYGHEVFEGIMQDKNIFIKKLIENRHESVLEHINISVFIKGCSRSFMAQITRHRMASYSIKSQHYVKHKNFEYKKLESPIMEGEYIELMKNIDNFYCKAIEQGMPHYIAREVLPNACLTNIYMTANLREWRHILKLRCPTTNTPEIRAWSLDLLKQFYALMPEIFFDIKKEFLEAR